MSGTISWQWGICGFGYSVDMFPELRLGILRVFADRAYIIDRFSSYETAMDASKRLIVELKAEAANLRERLQDALRRLGA